MKEQPRTIKPLVVTTCIGLLASLAILLIAAWVISTGRVVNMQALSIAAVFVGAFITALGAIAHFKQRYLIVGLTASLGYFLFVFLAGGLVYFRITPVSPVIGMLIASLAAGLVAGFLPRKKKLKRG